MRGYYYDQTGEAPRSTPAPIFAGRRRRWSGAAAVLLFLLTMALLGGLTAAAGLWSHSRLEELPALADSTWQPLPVREELPEETTVERAPTGDGTTSTAPHPSMTWLLVMIYPSSDITTPVPRLMPSPLLPRMLTMEAMFSR